MSTPTPEITRQRSALQLLSTQASTADACQAAARLEAQLEPPNLLEHVAPASTDALPALLWPSNPPSLRSLPTALFESMPQLTPVALPVEWLITFLAWGKSHRRWKAFAACKTQITQAGESAPRIVDLPVGDSLVAGLLLFYTSPEPDSSLRQHLLALALQQPMGAYLAAEAHHLPEEVPAIFAALQENKRLLHAVSRRRHFEAACIQNASSGHTLWDGLILARHPQHEKLLEHWLRRTAETARHVPAAAVAALVLQPGARENQQTLWRAILKSPAAVRWAFEAVWRARHTWAPEPWVQFKNEMRPYSTADRGPGWYNWSRLEPEWVRADYEANPVEPLWAMEWLQACLKAGQPVNDMPLRRQMAGRLTEIHGDRMATVVFRFLNEHQDGEASR